MIKLKYFKVKQKDGSLKPRRIQFRVFNRGRMKYNLKFETYENSQYCNIKVPLGTISLWIEKIKNKFKYIVYWTNKDGSDRTIVLCKPRDYEDDFDQAKYMALGSAQNYFENYELKIDLEKTISILDKVKQI